MFFEEGGDGDGVGAHDGDANTGAGDLEVREAEDFSPFVEHFLLFFGIAGVLEGVDVWDDVMKDLTWVDFRDEFALIDIGVNLIFKLDDSLSAASRDGLVGGGDDAGEAEGLVQGGESHQGDDGAAVRVRDDITGMGFCGLGVNFGDDEGDLRVHAEGRGIIDDDASGLGGCGGKFLRDAAASGEEGDVNACEAVFGEFLHDNFTSAEGEFLSSGACGGQEGEFSEGEVSLFKADEHFAADCSGGSDDGDMRLGVHGRREDRHRLR